MKKVFALIPLLALSIGILYAQDDDLPPPSSHPHWRDSSELPGMEGYNNPINRRANLSNYIIEPDLMFSVGEGAVNIGLSPYVGYRVWKNLYAGGGLTYFFTDFRNIGYADVTGVLHFTNAYWHTFGGGAFLQYNVWRGLFIRNRFEVLHRVMDDVYDASVQLNPQNNSYHVVIPKVQWTIPDDLLGIGYNLLEGKNFFLPLMISYNVLSPLTNNTFAVYPRGYLLQLGFLQVF